jgi:prepilin-type N-terminal cleavage/methylation domain-containing protein
VNAMPRVTRGMSPIQTGVLRQSLGFTLLEVLVALMVLAVGSVLVLSLISGSLGNIRKVQLRTRSIEHAQEVMETVLLDKSIQQPAMFSGGFEDGSRWSVQVEDYEMPVPPEMQQQDPNRNMPVKLLSYTVEVAGPDSRSPDYRLHTLKLVNKPAMDSQMAVPR